MKDGVYRLKIVITEVRTPILEPTGGLMAAGNWTGADVVAVANRTGSGLGSVATEMGRLSNENVATPATLASVDGKDRVPASVEMVGKVVNETVATSAALASKDGKNTGPMQVEVAGKVVSDILVAPQPKDVKDIKDPEQLKVESKWLNLTQNVQFNQTYNQTSDLV